jgi:hypothetical protein
MKAKLCFPQDMGNLLDKIEFACLSVTYLQFTDWCKDTSCLYVVELVKDRLEVHDTLFSIKQGMATTDSMSHPGNSFTHKLCNHTLIT